MNRDVRPCTRLANAFPSYHRDYCERYPDKMRELFQRQSPGAMMLSCCDSRTDPALLFSCHPGDLFVHRAIAALVPPLDSPVGACIRAATCYAVDSLKVRDLIVLGHTACGGISGLVKGVADTGRLDTGCGTSACQGKGAAPKCHRRGACKGVRAPGARLFPEKPRSLPLGCQRPQGRQAYHTRLALFPARGRAFRI